MRFRKELTLLDNKLMKQLQSTIEKSSRRDSEDSPEVLPSSRSVAHQKLRSVNSRIEFKTPSAPLVLPAMKVSFQVVVQLFFMPADRLTKLREKTSIKMSVSRLSDRHAESLARPFAKMLASRAPSLLTSFSKRAARPGDLMRLKESMLTCSKKASSILLRS